jgi:ATP-dependent Clp protease ATP-binding subunit ClpC
MFERFTERARQVVVLSQEEARNMRCKVVGTEHILLGLIRQEGVAARVLLDLGVGPDKAREIVKDTLTGPVAEDDITGQIPLSPRTTKTLELALREALALGHNYIGTEHILLGLVREGENQAIAILANNFQLNAEDIRKEVIRALSGPKAPILKEQAPERIQQMKVEKLKHKLDELKKTEELLELLALAVTLGRQFPDHPARRIAQAARELHG